RGSRAPAHLHAAGAAADARRLARRRRAAGRGRRADLGRPRRAARGRAALAGQRRDRRRLQRLPAPGRRQRPTGRAARRRPRRRRWQEPWSADAAAAAGFLLASIGFLWQFWLLPATSMPRGGGDLASFLYPTYRFAAESIQAGSFPFWNPHLYGGAPFAADLQ